MPPNYHNALVVNSFYVFSRSEPSARYFKRDFTSSLVFGPVRQAQICRASSKGMKKLGHDAEATLHTEQEHIGLEIARLRAAQQSGMGTANQERSSFLEQIALLTARHDKTEQTQDHLGEEYRSATSLLQQHQEGQSNRLTVIQVCLEDVPTWLKQQARELLGPMNEHVRVALMDLPRTFTDQMRVQFTDLQRVMASQMQQMDEWKRTVVSQLAEIKGRLPRQNSSSALGQPGYLAHHCPALAGSEQQMYEMKLQRAAFFYSCQLG
ncbi:hypothetical protein F4859DRAFT_518515 [Xylaria cf. heliscus]|nr:hypothetical protein F4859DRAFT_518515 [Xylaria cf. heliscus]